MKYKKLPLDHGLYDISVMSNVIKCGCLIQAVLKSYSPNLWVIRAVSVRILSPGSLSSGWLDIQSFRQEIGAYFFLCQYVSLSICFILVTLLTYFNIFLLLMMLTPQLSCHPFTSHNTPLFPCQNLDSPPSSLYSHSLGIHTLLFASHTLYCTRPGTPLTFQYTHGTIPPHTTRQQDTSSTLPSTHPTTPPPSPPRLTTPQDRDVTR